MKHIYILLLSTILLLSCENDNDNDKSSIFGTSPVLGAPTDLRLQFIEPNMIFLTWNDNCNHEEGYIIDRKIDNEPWAEQYKILPSNSTSYVDTIDVSDINFVDCGNKYNYRVCAFEGQDYSYILNATISDYVGVPLHLRIKQIGLKKICLTWDDSSNNETNFLVEKTCFDIYAESNEPEVYTLPANTTCFIDSDVEMYQKYNYHVYARSNFSASYTSFFMYSGNIDVTIGPYIANEIDCQAESILTNGEGIMFLGGPDVQIWDLNYGINPIMISSITDIGVLKKVILKDEYLYCASLNGQISIIDVSDIYNPNVVFSAAYGSYYKYICLHENYLLIGDLSERAVKVIDISDPTNPVFLYQNENIDYFVGIECRNDILYLTSETSNGVKITLLDISELGNFTTLGSYSFNNVSTKMTIIGDRAYMGYKDFYNEGFAIFDLTGQDNITLESIVYKKNITRKSVNFFVLGDYIYTSGREFYLYNTNDVSNLRYLGGYSFDITAKGHIVYDKFAYVIDGYSLNILQITE